MSGVKTRWRGERNVPEGHRMQYASHHFAGRQPRHSGRCMGVWPCGFWQNRPHWIRTHTRYHTRAKHGDRTTLPTFSCSAVKVAIGSSSFATAAAPDVPAPAAFFVGRSSPSAALASCVRLPVVGAASTPAACFPFPVCGFDAPFLTMRISAAVLLSV